MRRAYGLRSDDVAHILEGGTAEVEDHEDVALNSGEGRAFEIDGEKQLRSSVVPAARDRGVSRNRVAIQGMSGLARYVGVSKLETQGKEDVHKRRLLPRLTGRFP